MSPSDSREGFRLLVPHKAGCFMSDRPNPFVMHDSTDFGRNKNGVGRGMWAWNRFRCNDPGCSAVMLVRVDVLSDWIGRG